MVAVCTAGQKGAIEVAEAALSTIIDIVFASHGIETAIVGRNNAFANDARIGRRDGKKAHGIKILPIAALLHRGKAIVEAHHGLRELQE